MDVDLVDVKQRFMRPLLLGQPVKDADSAHAPCGLPGTGDNRARSSPADPLPMQHLPQVFLQHEGGGRTAAILMSLLMTAKAAGIHPGDYLSRRAGAHLDLHRREEAHTAGMEAALRGRGHRPPPCHPSADCRHCLTPPVNTGVRRRLPKNSIRLR